MKNMILLALIFSLSGCQIFKKRTHPEVTEEPTVETRPLPGPVETAPEVARPTGPQQPEAPAVPVAGLKPRLALILGPGGLRSFAHAGLLQEIAKAKIPIFWIGGLEMGAMPAALFALKGQPFEAEWQMMKLKEDSFIRSGILTGSAPLKGDTLAEPLKLMFGAARAEDAKIPFMCPSYSLPKRQTLMMNRGPLAQMLVYCLPSAPMFDPTQGSGANPLALTALAQSARQKGSQLVVYIDLLSENSIGENESGFVWGLFQQSIETQARMANEVFKIGGLSGPRAFDRRREMLQKGQEAGRRLVQLLQTKYGY